MAATQKPETGQILRTMGFHRLRSLFKTRRGSREGTPRASDKPPSPLHSPSIDNKCYQTKPIPEPKRPVVLPETNSAVYIRNIQYSRLYQLPEELLLTIGDNLDPIQVHVIRLTGRLFHRVFRMPTYPGPVEAHKLARLMEEDYFLWHCRRERAFGIADARKLACSKCRCLHLKSDFTEEQFTAEYMKRVCKAAQARVWICEHASLTFDEVVALRKRIVIVDKDKVLAFKICTHPDHGSDATKLAQCAPMINVRGDGTYIISRSIIITSVQNNGYFTKHEWQQLLSTRSESICPNISLHDHEVILPNHATAWHRLPFEPEEKDYPFFKSKLGLFQRDCTSGYCRNCNSIPRSCRKEGCDAKWTISRRHGATSTNLDEFAIDIKRTFGLTHTPLKPMHQTWRAQTKRPEELSETSISGQTLEDGKSFAESRKGEFDPFIIYLRASGLQGSAQAIYWEELPSLYRSDGLVLA